MNKDDMSKGKKDKMSVLLKYYIQKVFTKIKAPSLPKQNSGMAGKTGKAGRKELRRQENLNDNSPCDWDK